MASTLDLVSFSNNSSANRKESRVRYLGGDLLEHHTLTMKTYNNLLISLLLILLPSGIDAHALKIDLSVGTLEGKIDKAVPSGKAFASFTSIPYAEPPTGHLRFKEPVEKSNWSGILDATKEPPKCIRLTEDSQRIVQDPDSIVGQEDCLVLNIYTPVTDQLTCIQNADLPVMVWFHGGGFVYGDGGPDMYGPDYFMSEQDHPVILVTLNYRLGVLGFLSLGDDVIGGNMALKDQHLALTWVQKNIKAFGGDPQKRNVINRLLSLCCTNAILLSSLVGSCRVWRELFGLIDVQAMTWIEGVGQILLTSVLFFVNEMTILRFLYIVVWKHVVVFDDRFWTLFLTLVTYSWALCLTILNKCVSQLSLILFKVNASISIKDMEDLR